MDIAAELSTLKDQIRKKIVEAVNDTTQLSSWVQLLEDLERDTGISEQLNRNLEQYRSRIASAVNGSRPVSQRPTMLVTGGRKQRGKSARETFSGSHGLEQVKGRVYATVSGSRFGIAWASEDKRGSRWWLGLPDEQFGGIVLLCQDGSTALEFVIPMTSLTAVWPRLSRSTGEVKFNIKADSLNYQLMVPRSGPFDITRFLGDYSPLN